MKLQAATRLRAAKKPPGREYVFGNPKKGTAGQYSGEYVVLVEKELKPQHLKKLAPGVYTQEELLKKSGLGNSSSYLRSQLPYEYGVPEISTGRVVTVNPKGQLEFTTHMGKKITVSKSFTDFLLSKKYLTPEEEVED